MDIETSAVIVRDEGFAADDWAYGFHGPGSIAANSVNVAIDLAPDADAGELLGKLDRIEMIRIGFPSFADGRGFSLARRLRLMGFRGRLRAQGHLIADQYAMARRAGFDEVEISAELAERQPEDQWQFRADWRAHDYQSRLRGGTPSEPAFS